uniref:Secreted protein n=1 Tax=Anopheles darlingi TaxID=43151 RepID=A0A2M4DE41_ANODA
MPLKLLQKHVLLLFLHYPARSLLIPVAPNGGHIGPGKTEHRKQLLFNLNFIKMLICFAYLYCCGVHRVRWCLCVCVCAHEVLAGWFYYSYLRRAVRRG